MMKKQYDGPGVWAEVTTQQMDRMRLVVEMPMVIVMTVYVQTTMIGVDVVAEEKCPCHTCLRLKSRRESAFTDSEGQIGRERYD